VQIYGITDEAHPSTRQLDIAAAKNDAIALARQFKVTRQHFVHLAFLQRKNAAALQGVFHHGVRRPFLDHLAVHEYVRHEHTVPLDFRALVGDLLKNALLDDPSRGLHNVRRPIYQGVLQVNQILGDFLLLHTGVYMTGSGLDLFDGFCKDNLVNWILE